MHVLQTLLTQASVVVSERLEGIKTISAFPVTTKQTSDSEQWLSRPSPAGDCALSCS